MEIKSIKVESNHFNDQKKTDDAVAFTKTAFQKYTHMKDICNEVKKKMDDKYKGNYSVFVYKYGQGWYNIMFEEGNSVEIEVYAILKNWTECYNVIVFLGCS